MAADVEEFLAQYALPQPVLIGHSMGAKVAMTVALQSPQKLSALISVDNAPADAVLKSDFARYIQGMREIEDAKVTKNSEADMIMTAYEDNPNVRQFLLTNLIRRPDSKVLQFRIPLHTLALSLDKMGDFPFKNPEHVQFTGPALFIRGTKSHYVADEMLPVIGRFFPRFELCDIDAGHWVMSEQYHACIDAVINFLTKEV